MTRQKKPVRNTEMSQVIHKKVLSKYFKLIQRGEKTFELRLADWGGKKGNTLVLNEIDGRTKELTGGTLTGKVGFVCKTRDFDFWTKEEVDKHGYQNNIFVERGSKI